MNFAVLNNGHLGNAVAVARSAHKFFAVAAVDFADNLINSRQYSADKVLVPLFESLRHNRMVCVSECVGNNVPSLIPTVTALIKQYSHKFGDSECGVSIIDMNSDFLVEVVKISVYFHMPHNYIGN